MNKYEAKLAARKARYEERAQQARSQSEATYNQARSMAAAIPFGQPILVGHHSEGRDRRYRGRIHDKYRQAFALHDKAQHYAAKAESVGTGGISSDDPEAIDKLRQKLAKLEHAQEVMKKANALIRAERTDELQGLGLTSAQVAELLKPDFMKRIGFPSYALQNNRAEIRRVRERIEALEAATQRQSLQLRDDDIGAVIRHDADENRVMFLFDRKPAPAAREILKRWGFRWSPSREAWVRQWTNAATYAADRVRAELLELQVSA